MQSPGFANAPCILANNDVKYETNKWRAQEYAIQHNEELVWSMAKDKAKTEVLRDCPPSVATKLSWLTRHDKDTGDLYGIVGHTG